MPLNPFRRRGYISSAQLAAFLALRLVRHPRQTLEAAPVLMYTEESEHDKPGDPERPMWHNLGYWKTARTYAQAGADLARYLATAARIEPTSEVLDVGCGCAEQDILWARELQPARIVGVDITPARVALANRSIANADLHNRVKVHLGSATELPFDDASFDKVVGLESAFHFRTRETFLAEAFRVLRPGGRLALTDMLPAPRQRRSWIRRLVVRLFRRFMSVPDANVYDRFEYATKLRERGFVDVSMDSIGDFVFPGFARLRGLQIEGNEWFSSRIDLEPADFVAEHWLSPWRDTMGLEDYVVVAADKTA
jgi:microcystin synthetase protein McyJ